MSKGAYRISPAALQALRELMKHIDQRDVGGNWVQDFDDWCAAAAKCREAVICAAATELGQPRS